MKCQCETCNGSGEISRTCDDCRGTGSLEINIEDVDLHRSMTDFEALSELQEDVRRSKRDASRLIEINPAREIAYQGQLAATLAEINKQANRYTLD